MSGARSRTKGHNFERETANKLKAIFPEARRGFQMRDGADAPDVMGTPFWVECKVGKRCNIKQAMLQAVEATDGKHIPVVVTKEDRGMTMVTMELEEWLEVVDGWRRWAALP